MMASEDKTRIRALSYSPRLSASGHFAVIRELIVKTLLISASLPFIAMIYHLTAITGGCRAEDGGSFISKTFIDTTVQNAFYKFNAAAAVDGAVYMQKQAIAEAKEIVEKLKRLAEGDQNYKYILWKVGELEQHIWLEEQDLEQKKREKLQKIRNELIDRFNCEVGKSRPDFYNMNVILNQMEEVDGSKADQINRSIFSRKNNVSREIVFSIEKALITGDLVKARNEIDYCYANRAFLNIPQQNYDIFESKIQARLDSDKMKSLIKEDIDTLELCLAKNHLYKARTSLRRVDHRVSIVKGILSGRELEAVSFKIKRAESAISHKEDSLVAQNLRILEGEGVDAAIDYMEFTLRRYGVLPEKISKVDNAIMAVPIMRESKDDKLISGELEALAYETGDNGFSMEAVHMAVKKKAQARADSLRIIEEKRARKERGAKRREAKRLEKERKKEAALAAKKEKKRARMAAAKKSEKSQKQKKLEPAVSAAKISSLTPQTATYKVVEIYTFLEENNAEKAQKEFQLYRSELEKIVHPDVFKALENSVTRLDEYFKQQEKETAEEPQTLYVKKNGDEATFSVSDNKAVAGLEKKREEACRSITQIYLLLEENDVRRAYDKFSSVRDTLQRYALKDAFETLETTVKQAYEYSGQNSR